MSKDKLNWHVSDEDQALIDKIVNRAAGPMSSETRRSLEMDLIATHNHNGGLRLADLLVADDFNFNHDISGIVANMDRVTGKLGNFFLPRFCGKG